MTQSFSIVSPVDGSVYASLQYASSNQIAEAVANAKAAFPAWSGAPLEERIEKVRLFAKAIGDDREGLAKQVSWQMGRPLKDADEAGLLAETADYFCDLAKTALADTALPSNEKTKRFVRKAPFGVHLAICAWNFPVAMVGGIVIPALISGNTVLFKHAPQTALISDTLNAAAEKGGLGDGVFRALHMTHPDAERLIGSGDIQSLQFIGSSRGGRAVKAATGDAFVSPALELGGKDATYVRPDADIETAAEEIAAGSFDNSGQSCCSVERIYVHDDVYDRFMDAFIAAAESWKLGHPIDAAPSLGPVVTDDAAARIRAQIDQAVHLGARSVLAPDRFKDAPNLPTYLAPHVILDADHSMTLMRDETFGPVAPVVRVSSDEEALALMDDTTYGLTAGVWTQDQQVMDTFARKLEVGLFYQNNCDHADPFLPWGGLRDSGIGRTDGQTAFEGVTQYRSFHYRTI